MERTIPGTAALTKGITVLFAISRYDRPVKLTQLQTETGIPKGTLHRILQALILEGLVLKDAYDKNYRLGYGLLKLARILLENLDLRDLSRDLLVLLRDEIGEAVHLAAPEKDAVIYLEIIESNHPIGASGKIGTNSLYHCSASGKVIAAFNNGIRDRVLSNALPKLTNTTITSPEELERELLSVREQGFAINNQEEYADVCGIAVPIIDRRGQSIAAISISIPSYRFESEKVEKISAAMKLTSSHISDRI